MADHSIDDMAKAGCTSVRMVRHWEEIGLLGSVARSSGDHRRFTDNQMQSAQIIAACQFGAWSLAEIKVMLEEYHTGMEVYSALEIRLTDQIRAATRLLENLPQPLASKTQLVEYDL